HLGGPDNITAYALEDSKLWKRHLLILVVQVAGAGYVLYKYIAGSGIFITLAAILILVVGVAKYGERTWALRAANFSILQSSLKATKQKKKTNKVPRRDQHFYQEWYSDLADERILQRAHSLFHICKRGLVDSVIEIDDPNSSSKVTIEELKNNHEKMWRVMEMELSLMYDILYTKANVIHSWVGYCIRIISPFAVIASLVLFELSDKDGYSRVDIAITHTLLGGALVLETKSLLGALGSSWALGFLCATRLDWLRHSALCTGRWYQLRRTILSLRRSWPGKIIMTGSSRRWSGTIGQHNMLRFRAGQVDPMSRRLGSLFKMMGLDEWCNTRKLWTIDVSEKVKERARKWMAKTGDMNTMGLRRTKWGELALNHKDYPKLLEKLEDYNLVDFHESVICWHIATHIILAKEEQWGDNDVENVEVVSVVSNYMMFLLVDSPEMLPGLPQNWLYEQTCKQLDNICQKVTDSRSNNFFTVLINLFRPDHHRDWEPSKLEKDIASAILKEGGATNSENPRLTYACVIADTLLAREENVVTALLNLWLDFLTYAANRCNREAHARKLSTGGELLTIIWLYLEHLHQVKERRR
ncbi:uncharacterized protein LOC123424833, partial [Hordeum vulgare subsp. vulgare]